MRVAVQAVAAGCFAVVLLPGCTSSEEPPATAEAQLEVSVSQFREDEGTRDLRGAVTNAGDESVTVSAASLAWSGFERDPVSIDDRELATGATVGLQFAYGDPRCPPDSSTDPERPSLAVEVDGAERLVPLDDEDAAVLRRLHEVECLGYELEQAASVDLELADHTVRRAGKEVLPGEVVVRRRDDTASAISVVDLAGSVLLALDPARGRSTLPARLAPADPELRVPVVVSSTQRCDPHALGNSSQTFLLSSYVRLDRKPVQRVVAFPDRAATQKLTALIDRECA